MLAIILTNRLAPRLLTAGDPDGRRSPPGLLDLLPGPREASLFTYPGLQVPTINGQAYPGGTIRSCWCGCVFDSNQYGRRADGYRRPLLRR